MQTNLKTKWGPSNFLLNRWVSYSITNQYVNPIGSGPPPTAPVNGAPGITNLTFNHSYHGGRIVINQCQDLESVDFPNLTTLQGQYLISGNPKLTEVTFPLLEKWFDGENKLIAFAEYDAARILNNPLLTNLDLGSYVPNGAYGFVLTANAFPQALVDAIIMRFVNATNWKNPGSIRIPRLKISGNATPSAGVQAAAAAVNADTVNRNVLIDWTTP